MGNYAIFLTFENPRRGRLARDFTTNAPKILDLKSSSEQIFSENCRWVPLHIRGKNLMRSRVVRGILSTPACYRKVPIVATPRKLRPPESNVKSFGLLINPENSDSPKVATPPKVASPKKYQDYVFFNYKHTESYAFNVFQLESIVKLLMYNINIFVHFQIYHEKALDNKEKMACLELSSVVNVSSQIVQCKNDTDIKFI